MIIWKSIRYGHMEQLREIREKIAGSELTNRDAVRFILSFVTEWDFADVDTGQPLALDDMDNLSIPQYNELLAGWEQHSGEIFVKKTNGTPLSSSLTPSKTARQPA